MFETMKAKMFVWSANQVDMVVIPDDRNHNEIVEAMYIDGASVRDINQVAFDLWQEKRKEQKFVNEWFPLAETNNGPLTTIFSRKKVTL